MRVAAINGLEANEDTQMMVEQFGNTDDYLTADRQILDVESGVASGQNWLRVKFRGDDITPHGLAVQAATIFNTVFFRDAFGNSKGGGFLARTIEINRQTTAILEYQTDPTISPVQMFLFDVKQVNDPKHGRVNAVDIAVEEGLSLLPGDAAQLTQNLLFKMVEQGFPRLGSLLHSNGKVTVNPMNVNGIFCPTVEFYEANNQTGIVRTQLLDFIEQLEGCISSSHLLEENSQSLSDRLCSVDCALAYLDPDIQNHLQIQHRLEWLNPAYELAEISAGLRKVVSDIQNTELLERSLQYAKSMLAAS